MSNRLQRLRGLLADRPADPFLRFALAREHQNAGDLARAAETYAALRASDPGYVGLYYHYAATLVSLGRDGDAGEVYRAGIAAADAAGDTHAAAELRNALLNWELERD